jgi:hypothetical protein
MRQKRFFRRLEDNMSTTQMTDTILLSSMLEQATFYRLVVEISYLKSARIQELLLNHGYIRTSQALYTVSDNNRYYNLGRAVINAKHAVSALITLLQTVS